MMIRIPSAARKPRFAQRILALLLLPAAGLLAGGETHEHDARHEPSHEHGAEHHHEGEHRDEVTLTAEAIRLSGIVIETTKKRPLESMFTATARVTFNLEAMAHVGTTVEGRIAEILVRLGDTVKKGDVLLVVDSPALGEAQSDLLQKRAAVEVARTAVEIVQTAYERAKKLVEGKGISQAELLKREGDFKTAKGALLGAQAAAAAAENKLHLHGMDQARVEKLLATGEINPRYKVLSPISGTAIERDVTLGEVVGPDSPHLLVLADTSTLWVIADVPESHISGIMNGSSAQIRSAGSRGEAVTGVVSYVSPMVDESSRTGKVRIELSNSFGTLRPGMFAQVELTEAGKAGDQEPEVLAVPESAIHSVEGEPAVFAPVEGEENTFAKRAICVGAAIGNWVPVLCGLKEGNKIVTSGSFILKAELGKEGAAHEH